MLHVGKPHISSNYYFHMFIGFFVTPHIVSGDYGPFSAIAKEAVVCEGLDSKELLQFKNAKIKKLNRTSYTYSVDAELSIPLSDDLVCKVMVWKWGNGGWKPVTTLEMPKACTFMKDFAPGILDFFMKQYNISSCPIPAGSYEFADFPLSQFRISNSSLPTFEYGKYKVYLAMETQNEDIVGCIGGVADCIPKKRNG